MIVSKDAVVSLDVEIWDLHGNRLEQTEAPLHYLHGGYDEIFPPVERALEGRVAGDTVEVQLEPEEAFGEYDEDLIRLVPRLAFPEVLEVGMQFEGIPGETGDSGTASPIYTVTDIADEQVVLDGNHPFAGIAIKFRCKVVDVRPATAEEIELGRLDDDPPLRVVH